MTIGLLLMKAEIARLQKMITKQDAAKEIRDGKQTYDPKCLELANHFNEHPNGCQCESCDQLAQDFQDAAEAHT